MVVPVTTSGGTEPRAGFTDRDDGRPAAESVGERLLGVSTGTPGPVCC